KGRGDDDRPRAQHPDRDSDKKLAAVEPAILLHQALFEKWHDDEAAAKRETACLEKEREERAKEARGRLLCVDRDWCGGKQRGSWRQAAAEQRPVIKNTEDAGADEQDRDLGLQPYCHDKVDRSDDPLRPVLHPELGEP